ncbi:MAG: hypothetical protein G01um10143_15 [Parcubacteria group bacterium Gr01-1014_3]|nr:MAG: hypothetical protein G01um10143_15 [Parcubacteria group bacterium Gr01-1014_3]
MFHKNGPTLIELIKQGLSSTQKGYDLLAPKFDFTPFRTSPIILDAVMRQLGEKRKYDDALDLCTGTGAGISALLKIVQNNIVGVDWSEPMLDEAKKRFGLLRHKVDLVHQDIFSLEYREQFDLVTCFGAEGHIERHRQKDFIGIIHSSLRSGGEFVFVTGEMPSLLSPALWIFLGFDLVMRVRNILIKPPFVMYYLNFLLPNVLNLFKKEKWSSVKVVPLEIWNQPTPLRLVIATKK